MAKFFDTNAGKAALAAGALVAVVACGYVVISTFGRSDAAVNTADRVFICSETGKAFNYTLKIGDRLPVKSPYSGKNTGYESERCYWTKEGKPKSEPSFVLVNSVAGKPGPTFCPDCGRLVVGMNPVAIEGAKPPPTANEYRK